MNDGNLKLEDLIGGLQKENGKDNVDNVAIIGAGQMGRGIAQTIAAAGFEVLVVEKNEHNLEIAKANLQETMEREIARWAMTSAEMKSVMSRIKWVTEIHEVKNSDIIIEAIIEDLEAKSNLFWKLDNFVKEEAIFVTNTSTLSLSDMARVIKRKDRLIGLHFLNPVPKIPVVEVIKHIDTSEKTVEIIKQFAKKIKKTAVEVYDYPGYVTTRAIVPLLNEAMHILQEGIATAADIDTALKLGYSFNIGPLALADQMGLDEVLIWMTQLWNSLGEPRYRPCAILRRLVRERKLGVKSGEGFFKYDENGKIV